MVELERVGPDDGRLVTLLLHYMEEWSRRITVPRLEDGSFPIAWLDVYQDRLSHAAYLLLSPEPIGFALAVRDDEGSWAVEEFHVDPPHRRHGLGTQGAQALFAAHPGPWNLTVREENPDGLAFWRRAASSAEETVELGADGITRTRFRFNR